MSTETRVILSEVLIGVGATLAMDLWNGLLKRALGIASLNYCMLRRNVTCGFASRSCGRPLNGLTLCGLRRVSARLVAFLQLPFRLGVQYGCRVAFDRSVEVRQQPHQSGCVVETIKLPHRLRRDLATRG